MKHFTHSSFVFFAFGLVMFFTNFHYAFSQENENNKIRLLVRADDMGAAHAVNVACLKTYKEGIARSVEVLVPTPWFNEAVKMLNENPDFDVGVHLDLTSEWEYYKWGPITQAPSLVDAQGYFFPMTSQRNNFPPNTGFLQSNYKLDEVEKELRAQIGLAIEKIPQVSHLSSHMGTPTATKELKAIVDKLAKEFNLPIDTPPYLKRAGGFGGSHTTPAQKEARMVEILENLQPGTYLFIEHPALNTPEMEPIGHIGYRNVAADREGVTFAFTSEKVKKVVEDRGIQLISYKDLYEEQ